MAFDSSVIKCFVNEAENKIINSRIDKIHQPHKDELNISMRLKSGSIKLYISANPSYPRIFFTDSKSDNPQSPPMFCMLLRKHLTGGKIISVNQHEFERIITFEIETHDELMDIIVKKLIVEIMGKYSNIILTDNNGTIIDSIKRIDVSTSSVRQILPGLKYITPPSQEKLNPLSSYKQLNISNNIDIEKFIISEFYGVSKLTASEIAYRSFSDNANNVIKTVFNDVENNIFHPCIIYDKNGAPFDFSAIEIKQFNDEYTIEYNPSISYIIETFYRKKALRLRISQQSVQLTKIVTNNITRCKKKLAIFEKQLIDATKRDIYMQYGELITANCYRIAGNCEYIDVENFYDPELKIIRIPLDCSISPAKNAQKYYAKYNKLKNAEAQAKIWIEKVTNELIYLESVLDSINRMETLNDINEIKEELTEQGYVSVQTNKKKNKETNLKPDSFKYHDYEIYIGKNNKQNDFLTLKIARSNDLWFHVKDMPGSHVIVSKKINEEIPDEVILKAAKLASIHSKAKGVAKTAVDYTQIKNVKKPSGAKPGMVIYENYNTIYVNP
ncbi:MAG: NFACT family protein [Clostridia bacterium]|nr:NFACT family protein [Clostridia bacterium]